MLPIVTWWRRANRTAPPSQGTFALCLKLILFGLPFLQLLLVGLIPYLALGKEATFEKILDPESVELNAIEPSDDDLLILELRLNRLTLAEGLIAYQIETGICVYLTDIVQELDFPIDVYPEEGRAEGWFLREDRVFELDLKKGHVTIGDDTRTLDLEKIQLHFFDICVDTSVLADWFPITLEPDLPNALLVIQSLEPLPVEQRLIREKLRSRLRRPSDPDHVLPRHEQPYKMIDWPVIDSFFDFRAARGPGDDRPRLSGAYNMLITGDFLKMAGELFLAGDSDDPLQNARLRLTRKDPEGNLLGPLGAREFVIGDVATPQSALVAANETGRGVFVSSFPLDQPEEFDQITLRGDLLLGWEVELYRNGVLLDFQTSRSDGRYVFENVPVLFGRNDFLLLFYGPQGQTREELKEVYVGPEAIKPGDHYFRVAVNQQGQNLLQDSDDAVVDERQGELRFAGQAEVGVADGWSLAAGLFSLPFDEGRQNYGSLGLRGGFSSMATNFNLSVQDSGGFAAEGSLQGFVGPVNYFFRHGQFFDFESEQVEAVNGDFLSSRTFGRIDSVIPLSDQSYLPVSFSGEYERLESGEGELTLTNRLSTAYQSFTFSNDLEWIYRHGAEDRDDDSLASGTFLMNYFFYPIVLRGDVNYGIQPDTEVRSLSLTTDWDIDADLNARFVASHELQNHQSTFSAGLNRIFDTFALGSLLEVNSDGDFTVGVSLNLAFGRDPFDGSWYASPRPMAEQGALAARVFVDENANGIYDGEDFPMPGATVLLDERPLDEMTDEEGQFIANNLPSYQRVNLQLDPGSVEDPYLVPGHDGASLLFRPGRVAQLDFPLLKTGEVDGTIWRRKADSDALWEVSDVTVELVAPDGSVMQSVQSEFDGFYLFERVPLGRYRVRIEAGQLERLALDLPPVKDVALTADEPIHSGADFTLTRRELIEVNLQ
ncbi:MAG: carboxypeptidase-like regulatory domain-containing protein [Pseudomonadota bacterium]